MSHDSLHRFDRPLRVELQPSRLMLRAGLLLYLLALLSVAVLPWPPAWRVALCGALCLHFAYLYLLHIRMSLAGAVCALGWDARRGWRIRGPRGDWLTVTLRTPVFVSHRLAVARFRCGRWCRRSVLVAADSSGADDFRRLRVRLIQSAHGDRDRAKIPGQG